MEVLAVDPPRLEAFLASIAAQAAARAPEGVRPEISAASAAPPSGRPVARIPGLPGYQATATISERAVLEQARDRERFYWYIIGFSVAGILAGGLLTARAVMREVKLAKLKAGFVSNVSHGLKTPLTSLKMFADMLRSGQVKDEAERRECLDVIAQETERLGRLIQQVLDFGRLEARRRPFRWTMGPLEPVVRAEAERFRRTTGMGAEAFVVRIAVNTPPVTHDPDALAEVVSNLLSNAYKYTRREDRRIEVTLGPQRGRVVLAVEDNGPGVPRRERRRIFDQFYRADDLLTREVEGTGLGLAIARHIVQAHGGRIFVEDRPQGGSRFVVLLPAAAARAAAPPAAAETQR
jgi:signal transduction histidine kinase